MDEHQFNYDFTLKLFTYNGVQYRLALTPELFNSEDYLEFSGNYLGILISETKGTIAFSLEPDEHRRWNCTPRGMDPGIIDELDKIIRTMRDETI